MTRRTFPLVLAALLGTTGCLDASAYFFLPTAAESYDFEQVRGHLGGRHRSTIEAAHRREGFVETEHGAVHWMFASNPEATDVVLYSHGNTHNLFRYWDRVERLYDLGFHVLIYDYPGFGRSEGEPSEQGVIDAGRAGRDLLDTLDEADGARVFLYGYSLGGVPSFDLAAAAERGEVAPVDGLMGEALFCSIEELIWDGIQVGLPSHYATDLVMDNCARAAELQETPLLLMHGSEDTTVLVRHMTLLERDAGSAVETHAVEGAAHKDLILQAGDRYDDWITAFTR